MAGHGPAVMAATRQVTRETGRPLSAVRARLVLALDEPLPMGQLARRLGCGNSYVTALADTPEKRGRAAHGPYPTDRRVKVIALTPAALSPAEVRTRRDLVRKPAQE